ncbi:MULTISPECIES: monothiol bacilliredoxin BrxC family protein [unclassified Sporosarcina]|uniref:monothiol bacilliredoxin BrxC family protein n=1 Tax=unclassified Sporosarcina TaxID=2647733 RepID=UPI00203AD0C8|nr:MULTISPECIES: monothiol bacilliredoxin BrxC family protein [unclassified Sporosarcina]GKV64717.1 general stress protein [Sporosarcina sp. NCCP-2331]GLB54827.1 general stress protein [Sporosarcina sp. NCCP-2378]
MNRIRSIEAWRALVDKSDVQPFLLFKLSMTSFASIAAKKEMQKLQTELPIYVVIVQMSKKVSNAIESDLGVKHETPQLLIIKGKRGIWQATHYQIRESIVKDAIETYV